MAAQVTGEPLCCFDHFPIIYLPYLAVWLDPRCCSDHFPIMSPTGQSAWSVARQAGLLSCAVGGKIERSGSLAREWINSLTLSIRPTSPTFALRCSQPPKRRKNSLTEQAAVEPRYLLPWWIVRSFLPFRLPAFLPPCRAGWQAGSLSARPPARLPVRLPLCLAACKPGCCGQRLTGRLPDRRQQPREVWTRHTASEATTVRCVLR